MTAMSIPMFRKTVSALCYEIGDWHGAGGHGRNLQGPYNDVAEFVVSQSSAMPDFLHLPMRAATLLFDLWPIVKCGKPYHLLDPGRRRLQRLAWRSSRISAFRDLMRFYESLATLALYSRPLSGKGGHSAD